MFKFSFRGLIISLLLVLILNVSLVSVHAKQQNPVSAKFSTDFSSYAQNDDVVLNFSLNSDQNRYISAFILDIEFDPTILAFNGLGKYISMNSDDLTCFENDSHIKVLYLSQNDGICLNPNLDTNILTFNFSVQDANLGDYSIKTSVVELVDDSPLVLDTSYNKQVDFSVSESSRIDCRLKSLSTNVGKLDPDFSPNIKNYALNVSADTQQVIVFATAINEENKVTVSRKTLYKTGTQTPIVVSCKASSGESMDYLITVNRASEEDIFNKTSTKSNTKTYKNGNSSASIKKSSAAYNNGQSQGRGTGYINNGGPGSTQNDDESGFLVKKSKYLPFVVITVALLIVFICALFLFFDKNKKNNKKTIENIISDDSEEGALEKCVK